MTSQEPFYGRPADPRPDAPDETDIELLAHDDVRDRVFVQAPGAALLVAFAAGSAVLEERVDGGAWRALPVEAGGYCLAGAPLARELRWSRVAPDGFLALHVRIGTAQLAAAAREVFGCVPPAFALHDACGRRDGILASLLQLLRDASAAPAGAGLVPDIGQLLATHLVRCYAATPARPGGRGGLPAYKLQRILGAMRTDLARPFDLRRLAQQAGLSPFHFSRVFKQETGMSPGRYHAHLRIGEARRLLDTTNRSVIEIALMLGYRSPSHFASVFRRHVGLSPRAYRCWPAPSAVPQRPAPAWASPASL